ncbi:DUF58 domain-containing protein [Arenicella xantha]|uniref:Uncharacterized protein DUF58 n=1 Tax=Arenicella xantha TaxID=644221 RepID=A0A395JRG5_9GAMM|nr:DUF58 domain-containing protein [Arenicella xantha]RBP51290.1 uncharacterized protein DUF58 [Arenicella xantha]
MAINHIIDKHDIERFTSAGVTVDLARLLRSRHWAQSLSLFSRQAARSMLLGAVRSRFRGRGMEFEEVRHYQAGDDIRSIDWKVSARTGETYTKLFCEERERPCHIMVDQRPSLFFGSTRQFKSVLAAELAAALAWAALKGGDRIGGQVLTVGAERDSRARRNKSAVLKFIHDIVDLNHRLISPPSDFPAVSSSRDSQVAAGSLAHSLEECRRITRPGTAIFIISDFHDFDDAAARALSTLGKHTDLTLLQITDPLEAEMPLAGRFAISNGVVDRNVSITPAIQRAYLQELELQNKALQSAARQARARMTSASTQDSARDILNAVYRR